MTTAMDMAPKKKRTPKPKPTRLSDIEVSKYKKELKPVFKGFKFVMEKFRVDLDKISDDIMRLNEDHVDPPKLVRGEVSSKTAAKTLSKFHKRRNRLTEMKIACTEVKSRWNVLLTRAQDMLRSKVTVNSLRNSELRDAAVRQVIGGMLDRYGRMSMFVEELESMLWATKNNQDALIAQLEVYKRLEESKYDAS